MHKLIYLTLLATIPLLSGCLAPPLSLAHADLGTPERVAQTAPEYWVVQGYADPIDQHRGKRIVLTEFSIEFVTMSLEIPFDGQIFATPATPSSFAGVAAGFGKSTFELTEESKTQIATGLYYAFLDELASRDMEVIPPSMAAISTAYSRLDIEDNTSTGFIQRMNFLGSDTGRIKRMERTPPKGSSIVDSTARVILEQVQRDLMQEFDADYAMTVKFRVGLYRGKGSVEAGSLWRIWDSTGRSIVRSERSLLTDEQVRTSLRFKLLRGDVSTIDPAEFIDALAPVLRAYTNMAFEVLKEKA